MGSSDDSDSASKARETFFAPAAHATTAELRELVGVSKHPIVRILLESVQGFLMILDEHWQLLAANATLLEALAREGTECTLGLRPGELLSCVHCAEGPNGCGTSERCRSCGVAIALLAAQKTGAPAVAECHLVLEHEGTLRSVEFRVRATPLELQAHSLLVFVLTDISAEKRRNVLEKVFLHDLLNTLGGIEGWTRRLQEPDVRRAATAVITLCGQLQSEIDFYRLLGQAEEHQLVARRQPTTARAVLSDLRTLFQEHRLTAARELDVALPTKDVSFSTDRTLLVRVLVNMVKNALEATDAGGVVRAWCSLGADGALVFFVHNQAVIPAAVVPHMFERSFSTKQAAGRGVGTYSMRLFGETYLGGKVGFQSSSEQGTTFSIALPTASPLQTDSPAPASSIAAGSSTPTGAALPDHPRVLYVDDQPALLRLGRRLLERSGYIVTACSGGVPALQRFQADPMAFDLVISDVVMPGLDGLALAREIHALRPELPIIVTTGLLDTPSEDELRSCGVRAFLHKPMSMEDTLAAIARALTPSA